MIRDATKRVEEGGAGLGGGFIVCVYKNFPTEIILREYELIHWRNAQKCVLL